MRPVHLGTILLAVLCLAAMAIAGESAAAGAYKLTGLYLEFCSCERICESALLAEGRRSTCSFAAGMRIEAGQRGDISLGGLFAAVVSPDPKTQGARPGTGPVLYVDRAATAVQGEAIRAILNERFTARVGCSLGPPRPVTIQVARTNESLSLWIEGVADLRGRALLGCFGRPVRLENLGAATLAFPLLARGTGGQVADPSAGVLLDGTSRNAFYGKFDFGDGKAGRRRR